MDRSQLSYDELRAKLNFNINYLDIELAQQADLFQGICEECVFHGRALNEAKEQLEALLAQTEIATRKLFEQNAIKATEGKIEAEVTANAAVIALKQTIVNLDAEYQKWYSLKRAWDMRSSSIDSTTRMVLSGYIAYKKPAPTI